MRSKTGRILTREPGKGEHRRQTGADGKGRTDGKK